jgi:hypothetical protein
LEVGDRAELYKIKGLRQNTDDEMRPNKQRKVKARQTVNKDETTDRVRVEVRVRG